MRLNIFCDETGEFGFGKGSAKLYGVSLVLHEQNNSVTKQVKTLERKLSTLGFNGMIHMGDLVAGHGDFANMTIAERRRIYTALYKFSREIKASYHTIIIDKKNAKTNRSLSSAISKELHNLITNHLDYFQQFSQIKFYYDGGQKPLNRIINNTFGHLNSYEQKAQFGHSEKKLFQVADMLTYVDKIIYKYNKHIKVTKTEQTFFNAKYTRTVINELRNHRFIGR